ncbi:MAG: hypothetical protein KIT09_35340 [Bryobacteraceae bacterium]|nr:hypothetical protein [Bryobacteraceae bacterium]
MIAPGFAGARAAEPPPDLARRVAAVESKSASARMNYTYRQKVLISEFDGKGRPAGQYQEVRDILFSPETGRSEQFTGKPVSRLQRLRLTDEDFQDIREVQPFLFTSDALWAYETRYRGEERVDGAACYVLQVRPRQTFQGQRLFDGTLWVDQKDFAVVRAEGKAVPSIVSKDSENLFPQFTTVRAKVDGKNWFPVYTLSDDVLPFRTGPLRIQMRIEYSNYKRFAVDSTVTFTNPE